MKRVLLAALLLSLNFASASAQGTCESRAVSREGKPLAGAAKASFLKKCKRDSCQTKAVGRDGRPLAGAAKKASYKNARGRHSNGGGRARRGLSGRSHHLRTLGV